jgi:biopolymer transport protein ExbB
VAVLGAATAAAPQIPPEVATAAAVSARGAPSILELAVKGGPLMVPIAACSVVMLALAVERFAGLRRGRVMPQAFLDELQLLAEAPRLDVGRATALCERFRCPMAGMLRAALSRAGRPLSEVEKALEDAAVREIGKLQTAIRWLHFIANVSPLLGLLGTVQGMIVAFIVPSQAGLGKAELLAQGIYMALVTTFAGLVVAIPALTAAHYFGGRVHRLVHEMDELLLPVIPKLGP